MRVLVTGGAGFLGSHLCETLLQRGDSVVCVDDLSTGRRDNMARFADHPEFTFLQRDVSTALNVNGPAGRGGPPGQPGFTAGLPPAAAGNPGRGQPGHRECAEACRTKDRPVHPCLHQRGVRGPDGPPADEEYWGNVSSIGPRSVYDEAKRFAEAISMAYARSRGVNVGIVRIFNTFGPRMRAEDGRVVSSFIAQALNGDPLTIYGDGQQTRSFCYVDDLVRGIVAMIDSDETGPINLGKSCRKDRAGTGRTRPGDHGFILGHRVPPAPGGRPDPPPPGYRPGCQCARLAATSVHRGGPAAHHRVFPHPRSEKCRQRPEASPAHSSKAAPRQGRRRPRPPVMAKPA